MSDPTWVGFNQVANSGQVGGTWNFNKSMIEVQKAVEVSSHKTNERNKENVRKIIQSYWQAMETFFLLYYTLGRKQWLLYLKMEQPRNTVIIGTAFLLVQFSPDTHREAHHMDLNGLKMAHLNHLKWHPITLKPCLIYRAQNTFYFYLFNFNSTVLHLQLDSSTNFRNVSFVKLSNFLNLI